MTLQEFFTSHPKAALAFSGGVDSSYLLWAAKEYGCDIHAYYVHTAFQPAFELADAKKLAEQVGAPMTIIEADVLADPTVRSNPADRCYYCKQALFSLLWQAARADGYDLLLDGTNASDDAADRPGMKALRELEVRSPLQECGVTKAQVRQLSREAGLFTWDKPSYACLATRVPAGTEITAEMLQKVEQAEDFLFSLGFTDFRVRLYGRGARIQIPGNQQERFFAQREAVVAALKPYFDAVMLDLEPRKGVD